MPLFDQKVADQLKGVLGNLKDSVNIIHFTQENECGICKDAHQFASEICGLSGKLTLTVYDFVKDSERARQYNVDKIPALVICDNNFNDTGIKFYGIPGGYEINSFIQTLLEVSGAVKPLDQSIASRVAAIDKPVHIQVLISLQCPYCPDAVHAANRLALENKNIRAEMIDAGLFNTLAIKYNVASVPKTVINEKTELTGALPPEQLIGEIERALKG